MYWVAIYPLDQIKSAMATDSIIVSERKYPTMAVTAQVSFHVGACFVLQGPLVSAGEAGDH